MDTNGSNALTTQYVFSEDSGSFSSDNVAVSLVKAGTMSLVTLSPTTGTDSSGNTAFIASNQIVVNASGFLRRRRGALQRRILPDVPQRQRLCYYSCNFYPYFYRFDAGSEYFVEASDSAHAAYLYDFAGKS